MSEEVHGQVHFVPVYTRNSIVDQFDVVETCPFDFELDILVHGGLYVAALSALRLGF